jgi:TonB family protein
MKRENEDAEGRSAGPGRIPEPDVKFSSTSHLRREEPYDKKHYVLYLTAVIIVLVAAGIFFVLSGRRSGAPADSTGIPGVEPTDAVPEEALSQPAATPPSSNPGNIETRGGTAALAPQPVEPTPDAVSVELQDLRAKVAEQGRTIEKLDAELSQATKDKAVVQNVLDRTREKQKANEKELNGKIQSLNEGLRQSEQELAAERKAHEELKKSYEELQAKNEHLGKQLTLTRKMTESLEGKLDNETRSHEDTLTQEKKAVLEIMTQLNASKKSGEEEKKRRLDAEKRVAALEMQVGELSAALEREKKITVPGELVDARDPGVTQPALLNRIEPRIPGTVEKAGGLHPVEAKILIAETGKVEQVVVVNSTDNPSALNKAVIDACMKWGFRPAMKNGNPVKIWKNYRITFPGE